MVKENINIIKVRLDAISSKPWNPKIREDYEKEFKAIKDGIEKDGVIYPIVVRDITPESIPGLPAVNTVYEIIDGEQRYAIYKELGLEETFVNNLGKLSDEEAKAKAVNLENRIPLDYIRTSQLFSDIVGKVGQDKALTMLTINTEELAARMKLLDVPTYLDLELVDNPDREEEVKKNKRYFVKVPYNDLEVLKGQYLLEEERFSLEWAELKEYIKADKTDE